MKTNVFCVIAFVALVNGIDGIHGQPTISKTLRRTRSIEDLEICMPGETKMEDCNKCYCIVDGSGWTCTRRLCGSATRMHKDRTIDQPNQNNPLNQAVEEIHAEPNNHGRLLVTRSIKDLQICVPGETRMGDCSHCTCTADGSLWTCTASCV